jgi:hypothetical protein
MPRTSRSRRGEPQVAASPHRPGLAVQRFLVLQLGPFPAVIVRHLVEPATDLETFVTGRVLDDSVQRHVLVDDDSSHGGAHRVDCGSNADIDTA